MSFSKFISVILGRRVAFLAVLCGVVASERVSIAALRLLGLQEAPALLAKWKENTDGCGEFEAWAAGKLLNKLDIKPSRDRRLRLDEDVSDLLEQPLLGMISRGNNAMATLRLSGR